MPQTKSAAKELRKAKKRQGQNSVLKNKLKAQVKSLKRFIAEKKTAETKKAIGLAHQIIDKAAKKGIIKKNTASRQKSRLTKLANKLK